LGVKSFCANELVMISVVVAIRIKQFG